MTPLVSTYFDKFKFTLPDTEKNFLKKVQAVRDHYARASYRRFYVFFIDGIGYHFLQELRKAYPSEFLWLDEGRLESITSLYPSTTSVHVPAFFSSLRPEHSGVLEWWYYEPLVKTLVSPLKFRRKDGKILDSNLVEKIFSDPMRWPVGPKKFLWQEFGYSESVVTRHLTGDFQLKGYEELKDLKTSLDNREIDADEPEFHVIYLPQADAMSHRFGPDHIRTVDVWRKIFSLVRDQIEKEPEADFAFISDHGQSSITPIKTIYLNHLLPGIRDDFCKDEKGHIIGPAGSCRNFFLYLEPSSVDKWSEKIKVVLRDKALVLCKKDLIDIGFFLSNVSERFHHTCPSLIILPKFGESIWWDDGKRIDVWSQHGGITEEEMRVPFWIKTNSTISFEG